jgi:hypothetical protein
MSKYAHLLKALKVGVDLQQKMQNYLVNSDYFSEIRQKIVMIHGG